MVQHFVAICKSGGLTAFSLHHSCIWWPSGRDHMIVTGYKSELLLLQHTLRSNLKRVTLLNSVPLLNQHWLIGNWTQQRWMWPPKDLVLSTAWWTSHQTWKASYVWASTTGRTMAAILPTTAHKHLEFTPCLEPWEWYICEWCIVEIDYMHLDNYKHSQKSWGLKLFICQTRQW